MLAGEGDDSIAGRCGIPAEVVGAYASVFFDVRARLGRASYVLRHSIDVNQWGPEHAVGRAWKMLGYYGGPLVVNFMAAEADGTGGIDDFAVFGPAAPRGRRARLRRMLVAALTLELDPAAARRLEPLIEAMGEVDELVGDASCRRIDISYAAMVAGSGLTPGDAGRATTPRSARAESDRPGGFRRASCEANIPGISSPGRMGRVSCGGRAASRGTEKKHQVSWIGLGGRSDMFFHALSSVHYSFSRR